MEYPDSKTFQEAGQQMDRLIQHPRAHKQACLLFGASQTLQIHSVFYVSLLCLAAQDLIPGQSIQRPGLAIGTDKDDLDVHEVKSIIDFQAPHGWQKFKYLVKWKSWPYEYNTRKLVEHLEGSEEAIWMFHEQYLGNPRLAGYVHRLPSSQELT